MRVLFSFLIFIFLANNVQGQERRNIIWFTEKSPTSNFGFEKGQTVPNLSIKDVYKKRFQLHDNLSKLTIIDFRSINCKDCVKSNNYLKKFYEKYPINIISIYDDQRSVLIKDYSKKNQLIWTNVQDNAPPRELFKKQIGLNDANPDYIIIGPDKKVLRVFQGGKEIGKLGAFLQTHFAE